MKSAIASAAQLAMDVIWNLKAHSPASATGEKPKIVAHRGAWNHTTNIENTMQAFKRAQELGAWAIEFDVRFTKDNIPIINHDLDLRRYHRRDEKITDLTFKELRKLAPAVPTLEEVLALKNLHHLIEIKTPINQDQQNTLVQQLSHLKPTQDYHLLTLSPDLVRHHSALPEAAWMLVGELNLTPFVKLSLERGYCGVAGHYLGMTKKCLDQLRNKNQKTGAGFTPTKNLLNREHARGVDWVFTNHLDKLV